LTPLFGRTWFQGLAQSKTREHYSRSAEVGVAVEVAEGARGGVLDTRGLVDGVAYVDGGGVALLAAGWMERGGHESAVGVVEVLAVVLAVQRRELGAVDRHQLIRRDPQRQRHQRVDLQKRLAPVGVAAQRNPRCPSGTDGAEVRSAVVVETTGPGLQREWVRLGWVVGGRLARARLPK